MANKPDGTLQQIQGIYESGEMSKLQSWNDYLAEVRQQSANSKYIRKKVGEVPPPSDAVFRSFFEENKSQFFVPTTVRVSHIFFDYKNLDDAKKKEKLQKAKAVLAEIDSGKVTFEEQVRKYSEDQASSNRLGDIGPIPDTPQVRKYLGDEFMSAMLNLRSGQISRVVASKEGYHILKVTERAEGKKLKLEDPNPSDPRQTVYQLVQYQVMNVSYQRKAETIVKDLRIKANIKINEEIWSTWVTTNNTNGKAGS
jgi:parvulin-like peptidyl-prolyl isomerase